MLSDTILTNFACALFNLSTLLCAYQLATGEYSNHRSPSRRGWSYRRCLHVLLLFANLTRAASIITEIYVHESEKTNFYLALNFIVHSVPRVLTFSTDTMVLLFLGHLWTILTRRTFYLLRPFVIATNATAYLACSTIAGCASALSDHSQLVILSLWVLGSVNAISGVVACVYSKDIVSHMLTPGLYGHAVSISLISLSFVCVSSLFGNAAWLISAALMQDRLDDFAHLKMQVAYWVSSEFVPTMLLLGITSVSAVTKRNSMMASIGGGSTSVPRRFAWLASKKLFKQGVPLPMRDPISSRHSARRSSKDIINSNNINNNSDSASFLLGNSNSQISTPHLHGHFSSHHRLQTPPAPPLSISSPTKNHNNNNNNNNNHTAGPTNTVSFQEYDNQVVFHPRSTRGGASYTVLADVDLDSLEPLPECTSLRPETSGTDATQKSMSYGTTDAVDVEVLDRWSRK